MSGLVGMKDEFFQHLHGLVLHSHKVFKFQKYLDKNDKENIFSSNIN